MLISRLEGYAVFTLFLLLPVHIMVYFPLQIGKSPRNMQYIVRDPGFYARPKRFPRPGVKHVRKMISGVTEVLDQP